MAYINISLYHDAGYSSKQINALEQLLARNPSIHWIKLNEDAGIYELFVDNSLMSSFRGCPAAFFHTWVDGLSSNGRSWILDFGTIFHKMIEIYYKSFREQNFNLTDWAVKRAVEEWRAFNMDIHKEHKEYILIQGLKGFCTLLAAYANRFSAENERLRVIGTEISFGKGKEVPLGTLWAENCLTAPYFPNLNGPYQMQPYLYIYLSGRIDVLVDDRQYICPLDHKTKGTLRNDPSKSYEMDEGPTGYIYALSKIIPSLTKALSLDPQMLQRSCNRILMNYISKTPTSDPQDRFKRLAIMKTEEQLKAYELRMLATAEDLFRALVRYASTGVATRDTSKCTGMYGSDCMYLPIHRQNSKENELVIMKSLYTKKEIWDTEKREE